MAPAETPRPTRIEVDLAALRHNISELRRFSGNRPIMPVVKANAYGHGLITCAKTFESANADALAVGFLEEGLALRAAGIQLPILSMGGVPSEQIPHFIENDISMTASSVDKLDAMEAAAERLGLRASAHLKIDTGMRRIGVRWDRAEALMEAALRAKNVDLQGVYTHFAMSDPADRSVTKDQLERFLSALEFFDKRSEPTPMRHAANSAGMLMEPESHLDITRPGLALYGVLPHPGLAGVVPLRPALKLRSEVVYFKTVEAGEGVSYGWHWAPKRQTRVVTIPVGYGDGYARALSNRSHSLIRGSRYPNVGAICMDQFMVDIGPDGTGYNGDEVVLIGEQGSDRISVEDVAGWMETTPHEVLVALNQRVPRVYKNETKAPTA